jgi:hypothetical protein
MPPPATRLTLFGCSRAKLAELAVSRARNATRVGIRAVLHRPNICADPEAAAAACLRFAVFVGAERLALKRFFNPPVIDHFLAPLALRSFAVSSTPGRSRTLASIPFRCSRCHVASPPPLDGLV